MVQVVVDDHFARFGSKSYAIDKINTVDIRVRQPHGTGGAILFAALAALSVSSGYNSIGSPGGTVVGAFFAAAIFAGVAYRLWQKSKIREYLLFLMTSSSETQAFVSRDESEVMDLRDRIEAAMIRAGRRQE